MKYLAIFFIRLYQWCISPFLGECCRFTPSCSKYAIEAFKKYGFIKGAWLAMIRVVKCGPWHPGGVDAVDIERPEN